ncbi:hypothetical protein Tco_0247555 [Tanacetum coccineum]
MLGQDYQYFKDERRRERLLTATAVYGFWKHVLELDMLEIRRLLLMLNLFYWLLTRKNNSRASEGVVLRIPLILDADTLQYRRRQTAGECLQHMIASDLNDLRWDSGESRQFLQDHKNVIIAIYTSGDWEDKTKQLKSLMARDKNRAMTLSVGNGVKLL